MAAYYPGYRHCSTCTCCGGHGLVAATTRPILLDASPTISPTAGWGPSFGTGAWPSPREAMSGYAGMSRFRRSVQAFERLVNIGDFTLGETKEQRDRRMGAVQVPVVPRLRWIGAARIAGMDIRRLRPRQQRI